MIRYLLSACGCMLLLVLSGGCTSRGMMITSAPEGAEVSVNRRYVGKTPLRLNYTHYGLYRIELRKDRYETLVRNELFSPPFYGYDPLTFFADNVIPARINDESYLHYAMQPVAEQAERDPLLARAALAREGKLTNPRTGEQVIVNQGPEGGVRFEKPPPLEKKPAPKDDKPAPKDDKPAPAPPAP